MAVLPTARASTSLITSPFRAPSCHCRAYDPEHGDSEAATSRGARCTLREAGRGMHARCPATAAPPPRPSCGTSPRCQSTPRRHRSTSNWHIFSSRWSCSAGCSTAGSIAASGRCSRPPSAPARRRGQGRGITARPLKDTPASTIISGIVNGPPQPAVSPGASEPRHGELIMSPCRPRRLLAGCR